MTAYAERMRKHKASGGLISEPICGNCSFWDCKQPWYETGGPRRPGLCKNPANAVDGIWAPRFGMHNETVCENWEP